MSLSKAKSRSYARRHAHQTDDYDSVDSQTRAESSTQERVAAWSVYATEQSSQIPISSVGNNLEHIPGKRVALDGHPYTYKEFCEYYGAEAKIFWTCAASLANNLLDEVWQHILLFLTIEQRGWYHCFDDDGFLRQSYTCCGRCETRALLKFRGFYEMNPKQQRRAFYGCEDCRIIRRLILVSRNLLTLLEQEQCARCHVILANSAPRAMLTSGLCWGRTATLCTRCGNMHHEDVEFFANADGDPM